VSGQPYGTYPPTPEEPSLPIGVAILAVLIGIVGFLLVLAGVLLAALGISIHLEFSAFSSYGTLVVGVILLIIGLIVLGVALGLWHQRLWALVLAIIVFGLYFISDALVGAWFSLGAIISLILVVYLIAVHRHFI
jgi:amino acid transporter